MTFTYNQSANKRDQVRLLLSDVDADNPIFQDEEIAQFLSLQDDNVFRSAALALRTVAANQAMVLKVITILDLSTNGAAVAAELRQQADKLDAQAGARGRFAVSEFVLTNASARQRLVNEALEDNA